jgi:hypothetical protein
MFIEPENPTSILIAPLEARCVAPNGQEVWWVGMSINISLLAE